MPNLNPDYTNKEIHLKLILAPALIGLAVTIIAPWIARIIQHWFR